MTYQHTSITAFINLSTYFHFTNDDNLMNNNVFNKITLENRTFIISKQRWNWLFNNL